MITAVAIASLIVGVLLGALLQFTRVEDLKAMLATAQERNDRLVEAVSRPESNAPVMLPRPPVEIEAGAGWWDTKPPLA